MIAVGRIPDLRNVLVGPGDAAIDGVVFLPETPPGLESDLDRLGELDRLDGRLRLRREVVGDLPQDRSRDGADCEVRLQDPPPAAPTPVHDANAVRCFSDLLDDGPKLDEGLHPLLEGGHNGVHPADRLQQGGVLIEELAEMELVPPEIRSEQLTQIEGVIDLPRRQAGMDGQPPMTAARRAPVEVIRIQVSIAAEQVEDQLLVLDRQLAVEGVAVDGLGQEFGNIAPGIRHHPTGHQRPIETIPVVEKSGPIVVGEDLEVDSELPAIPEDGGVVVG